MQLNVSYNDIINTAYPLHGKNITKQTLQFI